MTCDDLFRQCKPYNKSPPFKSAIIMVKRNYFSTRENKNKITVFITRVSAYTYYVDRAPPFTRLFTKKCGDNINKHSVIVARNCGQQKAVCCAFDKRVSIAEEPLTFLGLAPVLWRSCATFFWNNSRQTKGACVLIDRLHEVIVGLVVGCITSKCRGKPH